MVRLIVRTGIALVGNAFGLIVAAAVLDKMSLDVSGFIVAVIVFTVVMALIQPFLVAQMTRGGANTAALGGVALIATFVSLVVTDLISNGIAISGVETWIAATVIVWAASVLAVFILPYFGLKKYLQERRAT